MKQPLRIITIIGCGSLLILLAILTMGASSQSPQIDYGTLRIYKKGYGGPSFGLEINDQKIVKNLKNRSWMDVQVPPGKLTLKTVPEFRYPTNEGKSFSLEIEPGKVYYLEAVLDYQFLTRTMYLVLREKERAEAEIKRFKQKKYVLKKVE